MSNFHLDLSSYVLVFDFPIQRLQPKEREILIGAVKASPKERGLIYSSVAAAVMERNEPLGYHEYYHFWQAISWPYLYIQAGKVREFYRSLRADIRSRVTSTNQSIKWPVKSAEYVGPRAELSRVVRVHFEAPNRLRVEPVTKDDGDRTLSVSHLLECAASLFQYRASVHEYGTPEGFLAWAKKNAAYTNPYRLMGEVLGWPIAHKALIPLIATCFHTTLPLPAFLDWLLQLKAYDLTELHDKEESDIYCLFMADMETQIPRAGAPAIGTTTVGFLSDEAIEMERIPHHHPVLQPFRARWIKMVAEQPDMKTVFVNPFLPGRQKMLMSRFFPPIQVYLLTDAPANGLPPAFILPSKELPPQERDIVLGLHSILHALDTIYGLRPPGPHSSRRACPWTSCRYYGPALCEGHLNPPSTELDAEKQCSFPALLKSVLAATMKNASELIPFPEKK